MGFGRRLSDITMNKEDVVKLGTATAILIEVCAGCTIGETQQDQFFQPISTSSPVTFELETNPIEMNDEIIKPEEAITSPDNILIVATEFEGTQNFIIFDKRVHKLNGQVLPPIKLFQGDIANGELRAFDPANTIPNNNRYSLPDGAYTASFDITFDLTGEEPALKISTDDLGIFIYSEDATTEFIRDLFGQTSRRTDTPQQVFYEDPAHAPGKQKLNRAQYREI